jgi:hypothetical protein
MVTKIHQTVSLGGAGRAGIVQVAQHLNFGLNLGLKIQVQNSTSNQFSFFPFVPIVVV